MPSHYCKCGHCTFDVSQIDYYNSLLGKSKRAVFNQVLGIYMQGLEDLEKIKKSISSEEGKQIEDLKLKVRQLVKDLGKEQVNIK